jgi:hypothetical protein
MDLFGFSLPYLAEQVSNMLISIVDKNSGLDGLSPASLEDFNKHMNKLTIEEEKKADKLEKLR